MGVVRDTEWIFTEQILWKRATGPFDGGPSRLSSRGGFRRNLRRRLGNPVGAKDVDGTGEVGGRVFVRVCSSLLSSFSPLRIVSRRSSRELAR